ncbi:MAG TPA: carbonic anhydrase [Anaerolineae bacterium]|nr:carbonic anhydrase [Anaerolineae bacterium]
MPTSKILDGISQFQQRCAENRELYERLAVEGQSPEVMFIGCSDSRVPPELITGSEPGDLFVHRNVANIVPPYGTGQMDVGAVVEYAVLRLEVKHIVLCGHTGCGAIGALDRPVDWSREPHIARWIEHARPAKTKVEASGIPKSDRYLATVRENVLLQLDNLRSYEPVRAGERAGTLIVHGWVYSLMTGMIEAYDAASGGWALLAPLET